MFSANTTATMAEWLYCLARTTKVLYSKLGTIRHRMTLDNHPDDAY
jgi:hypothetical protein